MSLLLKYIQIKQLNSKYATKFIYELQDSISYMHKRCVKYYFSLLYNSLPLFNNVMHRGMYTKDTQVWLTMAFFFPL